MELCVQNGVTKVVILFDKVLEPFVIDSTYHLQYITKYHADEVDEFELVKDILVYRVDRWEGLMDARTGKVITPAKYWSFEMISKELISAELGYGEEGVILDKRGRVVAYSRDGKRTYFA